MSFITTIIWFLVALVVLVAIHEYGHFLVARLCGVKVLRFSIGFGYRLFSWKDRSGTEFALSAIPLGGYVKMLDEREMEVPPEDAPYSFNNKHPWKKIAIASAGPIANLLLAILVYWVIAFFNPKLIIAPVIGSVEEGSIAAQAGLAVGQKIVEIDGQVTISRTDVYMALFKRLGENGSIVFTVKYPDSEWEYVSPPIQLENWLRGVKDPDVIKGMGMSFLTPQRDLKISEVSSGSAAEAAGLKGGDEILMTDGKAFENGTEWSSYIYARPEQKMTMVVLREGEELDLTLAPSRLTNKDGSEFGRAGVMLPFSAESVSYVSLGGLAALSEAVKSTTKTVDMVFLSIKKLIYQEISLNNLSGPIGIAKVAGDSARAGIWVFFEFLAMLSIYLGVLNLLPIPVLDGGHIVYSIIEWVKGSPLSEKIQMLGYQLGMVMLLCLVVVASYHDIFS